MGGPRWNKKYDGNKETDTKLLLLEIKENSYESTPKLKQRLADTKFKGRRNPNALNTQSARVLNAINGAFFSGDSKRHVLQHINETRQLAYSLGYSMSHNNRVLLMEKDLTIIHGPCHGDSPATNTKTPVTKNNATQTFAPRKDGMTEWFINRELAKNDLQYVTGHVAAQCAALGIPQYTEKTIVRYCGGGGNYDKPNYFKQGRKMITNAVKSKQVKK